MLKWKLLLHIENVFVCFYLGKGFQTLKIFSCPLEYLQSCCTFFKVIFFIILKSMCPHCKLIWENIVKYMNKTRAHHKPTIVK